MSKPSDSPSKLPLVSTFSFTAPFVVASSPSASTSEILPLKQRRVSLALPSSPRLVAAWNFRDDTGLGSHIAETSGLMPEKKGKMRKIANACQRDEVDLVLSQEKKQRKKWTMEETRMLVDGCNIHGVGNWKAILSDPNLKFDNRSPVDLKDRFRTYFPDAYKQHYPNAKTHLSSKVRSTLPDGSSIFEKTRSKKRRPFTEEEDRALKAGYEKHGTVWATIVKDPVFQEQNRRSTDLRDRFRNAFPELYQAAGYKPRNAPKKKHYDVGRLPVRAATDDQLAMSSATGPIRRRRAHTSQGLLRGGTKSVPQSTTCSEDEDSSGGEDENDATPALTDSLPQPETASLCDPLIDMDMETCDPLSEPLHIPDFFHSSSEMDSQSQTWSSGLDTPIHSHAWSTAAGSPTSSHLSSDYLMNQSPFHRRSDGMSMIGKSAWGTQDWFSVNPRLDSSARGGASLMGSASPSSSPFSFHNLNHGVLDRYDLFPTSFPHDFASEVGLGDSHSTFSDEIFPSNGFRGFTHHSNYAGDLIFGSRTHQPQQSHYGSGLGFGAAGLGLSGMQPPTGIHPMQLHTPALPGIDEIELTGISLNDQVDNTHDGMPETVSVRRQKEDPKVPMVIPEFSLHGFDDIVDLSHELHSTPPCTPITQPRPLRGFSAVHYPSTVGRSFSVPPSEARSSPHSRVSHHTNSQPQIAGTRSLPLFSLLTQDPGPPDSQAVLPITPSEGWHPSGDLDNLPFLDLHYYSGVGTSGNQGSGDGAADAKASRQGQALDLAQSRYSHRSAASPLPPTCNQQVPQSRSTSTAGRPHSFHHRGQSVVSPQDLLLRKGNDNKRKRASWNGGAF